MYTKISHKIDVMKVDKDRLQSLNLTFHFQFSSKKPLKNSKYLMRKIAAAFNSSRVARFNKTRILNWRVILLSLYYVVTLLVYPFYLPEKERTITIL